MKVRPVDTSPAADSGQTAECTPPRLSERVRALWQQSWQTRWADRAEQYERARGGTRLNDWPQPRPINARDETLPAHAALSNDEARTDLDIDRHAGPVTREPHNRVRTQGRNDVGPRHGAIDARQRSARNLCLNSTPAAQAQPARWPEQFDRLSQVMADLCGRRSKAPDSWNVHIELDPQLLPETMLHLSASQQLIHFRFACGAVQSHQLLSQNVDALRTRIASEIGESRPFDIEIE